MTPTEATGLGPNEWLWLQLMADHGRNMHTIYACMAANKTLRRQLGRETNLPPAEADSEAWEKFYGYALANYRELVAEQAPLYRDLAAL